MIAAAAEQKYLDLTHLQHCGLHVQLSADGNCLFRGISWFTHETVERHPRVRKDIAEELAVNKDTYNRNENVYTEEGLFLLKGRTFKNPCFDDYVAHVQTPQLPGDIGCLLAAANIYGFKFRIWERLKDSDPVEYQNFVSVVKKPEIACRDILTVVRHNFGSSTTWKVESDSAETHVLNLFYLKEKTHFDVLNINNKDLYVSAVDVYHESMENGDGLSDKDSSDHDEGAQLSDAMDNFRANELPILQPKTPEQDKETAASSPFTYTIVGRKKRKKTLRITHVEATKLMDYSCKHTSEAEANRCRFLSSAADGTAWNARVRIWGQEEKQGMSSTDRTAFMMTELRQACFMSLNGTAFYEHRVGNYKVCHDAWRMIYKFPESSLRKKRKIIEAEKQLQMETSDPGVSLLGNRLVQGSERSSEQATLTAAGWLEYYKEQNCDALPVPFIRQKTVEIAKDKALRAEFKVRYREHTKVVERLKAEAAREAESGPFDEAAAEKQREFEVNLERMQSLFNEDNYAFLEREFNRSPGTVETSQPLDVDMSMFYGVESENGEVDSVEVRRDDGTTEHCQYRIPHLLQKADYEEYTQWCAYEREAPVERQTFVDIWKKEFPYLKLSKTKGCFSICTYCQQCTDEMRRAKEKSKYALWKDRRTAHLDLQRAQRLKYYANRVRAISDKTKSMSLIADGMDQAKTELPVVMRRSDSKEYLKQKVMGVIAHGLGNFLYVAQMPVGTGANFTLECVWRTLLKLEKMYKDHEWKWPPTLHLQFDNCTDNKNKTTVAFLALLQECKVFDRIEFSFLLVGHTHEDIDQMFSVISRRFHRLHMHPRRQKCVTFTDFQREVDDAFLSGKDGVKPECIELVVANHDFDAWLKPALDKDFGGTKACHYFGFRRQTQAEKDLHNFRAFDDRCVVFGKEYMTDPDSLYSPNKERLRDCGPIVPLLNIDDPETLLDEGPGFAPFLNFEIDEAELKKNKKKMKKINQKFLNKSHEEIMEMKKETLREIIGKDFYGATEAQTEEFLLMIEEKVHCVENLSVEVKRKYVTQWKWFTWYSVDPTTLPGYEAAVVDGEVREAVVPFEEGGLTSYNFKASRIKALKRAKMQQQEVKSALALEKGKLNEIKLNDLVFCRTIYQGALVWMIGRAQSAHAELVRDEKTKVYMVLNTDTKKYEVSKKENADTLVKVFWLVTVDGKGNPVLNEMNEKFVLWKTGVVGKGPGRGTIQERDDVIRTSILLVGFTLVKNPPRAGKLKFDTMQLIAACDVGFKYNLNTSRLEYKDLQDDGGESSEMESSDGSEEEEEKTHVSC